MSPRTRQKRRKCAGFLFYRNRLRRSRHALQLQRRLSGFQLGHGSESPSRCHHVAASLAIAGLQFLHPLAQRGDRRDLPFKQGLQIRQLEHIPAKDEAFDGGE